MNWTEFFITFGIIVAVLVAFGTSLLVAYLVGNKVGFGYGFFAGAIVAGFWVSLLRGMNASA